VTRRRLIDQVTTGLGFRLFRALMAVLYASSVARALGADDRSTTSVAIRTSGLAACLIVLTASSIKGHRQRRRDVADRTSPTSDAWA
jgi:hypothetical protein